MWEYWDLDLFPFSINWVSLNPQFNLFNIIKYYSLLYTQYLPTTTPI